MKFEFTIPGKPCGKQRPRFGNGRTYTPEKTVNYENLVRLCFRQAYPNAEPISAGVQVTAVIEAYFQIPKSTSKKRRNDMFADVIRPTSKPDTDNIAKICLDALNGLAYHDDSQVVDCTVEKFYSDTPRVEIWIKERTFE